MSRLYTVNQWNRQKFLPREEDLYSFGGFLGSLGSSVKGAWGNIGSQASQSGDQAGGSMGGFGQSIVDMGLEIPGNMKIPGTKRGLYDAADPLYWAANGNESVVGNAVSDIGVGLFKSSAKSGNLMGMAAGGIVKGLGSVINASMGTKVDKEALRRTNEGTNYLKNFNSTATTTDEVTGPMAVQNAENAYGAGWFRKGWARRRNRKLRDERAYAQNWAYRALDNNINNIARNQIDMGLANYTAFGGPIDTSGMPFAYPQQDGMTATGYNMMSDYLTLKKAQAESKGKVFAKGGKIHINPKNRGKFNATKKRTGKTTEELTHSKNPLTRKRAIFALNSRKWRHDYGGYLNNDNLFAEGGDQNINKKDLAKDNLENLVWYLGQKVKYPNGRKRTSFEKFLNNDLGILEKYTEPWFGETPAQNILFNNPIVTPSYEKQLENILNTTGKVVRTVGTETKKNTSKGEPYVPHMRFAFGGDMETNGSDYAVGQVYNVSEKEAKRLKALGYEFRVIS